MYNTVVLSRWNYSMGNKSHIFVGDDTKHRQIIYQLFSIWMRMADWTNTRIVPSRWLLNECLTQYEDDEDDIWQYAAVTTPTFTTTSRAVTSNSEVYAHCWFRQCVYAAVHDFYDDVIKWKLFPRYWPFMRGIHRSSVNSPHRGQWRGALTFPLICVWINGWVNNREAGDLRRCHAHYDVTVRASRVKLVSRSS